MTALNTAATGYTMGNTVAVGELAREKFGVLGVDENNEVEMAVIMGVVMVVIMVMVVIGVVTVIVGVVIMVIMVIMVTVIVGVGVVTVIVGVVIVVIVVIGVMVVMVAVVKTCGTPEKSASLPEVELLDIIKLVCSVFIVMLFDDKLFGFRYVVVGAGNVVCSE